MAIYRCDDCEQFIDDDWEPCVEHPDDTCQLLCPACAEKYEEEE